MSTGCWGLDARALESMPNDRSNATLTQKTADGSFAAKKHATTSAGWASVTQVRCDRCADIRGKRKGGSLITFASDAYLPGLPINIFKLEKSHFA